jgi:pimeloyl-ACP methyl ester carboxylesterase/DNA-binding CsgD family transcriptional regulator
MGEEAGDPAGAGVPAVEHAMARQPSTAIACQGARLSVMVESGRLGTAVVTLPSAVMGDEARLSRPPLYQARSADGVTLAWTSVGSGPALVHLPGAPFSNLEAEWRIPVLRLAYGGLARHLRFIQFDSRGTGRSQRDVSDLSLDAMLRDLDAVVRAAGLTRFAVLGFYNSVTHAVAYAARHPDRVSHLILFGGSARGWSPMSGPATQALLSLIERDWDTFVESATHAWLGWPAGEEGRLAADWFRNATTPAMARLTLHAAGEVDVTGSLADVRCPVLVLHRLGQHVIPIEMSEELVAGMARAELRLLPGQSAGLFFDEPDDVVAAIVQFVTGVRPDMRAGSARSRASSADRGRRLTPREIDVLRLIAAGESNAEIAARLGVSVNTVERHVTNLYRKIDARGRADATAFAIREGIASPGR